MLYVTTRNDREACTAQRAMTENRGPEGGLYLPFHQPQFSKEELDELLTLPPNGCMAQILNLLFRQQITGWDIDLSVGRKPVRLESLGQKLFAAELWHNPQWNYGAFVAGLSQCLGAEPSADWVRIAVGIGVVFALCGQLHQQGIPQADMAVVAGDFSMVSSIWYARQWGAPVGSIVCACNENNGLWDLICHGQLRTDSRSIDTGLPCADVALPVDLERLVYGCGGVGEVERYLDCCRRGKTYLPPETVQRRMGQGLSVSVVSSQRLEDTISGVEKTCGCRLSRETALGYAGVLDYRAKTGRTGPAVILSQTRPEI